ncbi:Chemotaxis response regulator protein-glutamate methylesterase [Marinomonas spartinae]|uniref:Protein-glutamate methylesterase/protein-glutamine glutaminase n=1 Tax=Marinomonas spartinae TaxID=1792290 RepID=A0A1A8TMR8_9GAMM|nr:chemotaxis response regulator protein-glutamate methylesterase [Marinomonas spartinae]SBS35338.1 Chemotaxis response regulator protein-glutamate methylesterase [Marinomonas spartinae]SBS39408.1 Chemotaxis response regulator protein-glutamate methylesterase [Marinomonas spartinae]
MSERSQVRVLIVDDSELMRSLLTRILSSDSHLKVVGIAKDAYEAKEQVKKLSPDVITLDIEMPEVNGLRFLQVLMKANPIPVVMVSTLTEEHAAATLTALEYGAVDYMAKPKVHDGSSLDKYAKRMISKVRLAAGANVRARAKTSTPTSKVVAKQNAANRILAIGASTGGTEAIRDLLQQLPAEQFGVVISQHMPPGFTRTYAERLNRQTGFQVAESQGGEVVKPGTAYIAPGGYHLTLRRKGNLIYTDLALGEKVCGHRPSVDVMFDSVAELIGKTAIAVLLTGMGKDGAQGLKRIKEKGGYTVAQDEASCVVFGMPREAINIGATCSIQALSKMGNHLVSLL